MNQTKIISEKEFIDINQVRSHQPTSSNNINEIENLTLDEVEKMMIIRSLGEYNNNISKVSEVLGVSRAALYRRLEKYGISS